MATPAAALMQRARDRLGVEPRLGGNEHAAIVSSRAAELSNRVGHDGRHTK
jgi:hypothetical protein